MAGELDDMIRKLRAIPGIVERASTDAADAVRGELERTIAAGTTSDGQAWTPRKLDGGRPLADAAKALYVAPVGTRIYARLTGHIARHHLGRARGGLERPILPTTGKLPAPMARALRKVLVEHFTETVKGA